MAPTMFYFCAFILFGAALAQNPVVNTTQGEVQGAQAADGDYLVFYGVHYAGSSSGDNRFKPPTPPARYPGVYHAIDNSIVCAHPTPRGIVGQEDCLVLNIHTKNLTTPKPVMVILLGDEYTTTDTKVYSQRRLVLADIVVVTINYRLSIFGFLCLGVPDAQGNAGLKDVVQGLKWIKDNIGGFGGDPANVVLLGHGSGAAMVDLITLSPSNQDLVHKAIVLSGSALAPWAIAYEPLQYAQAFAERLSYTDNSPRELAQKLRSTDLSLISSALEFFSFTNNSILFAPCLENPSLNDTFITQAPIDILRSGNFSHIPYMTGYTDREGTIRAAQAVNDRWLELMQANFTNFVQVDLDFDSITNKTAVANSIKNFYFGASSVNMATIKDYLTYHGDTSVLVSVIRGARERAATSGENVRLLEFAYRGTQNSEWIYNQIPIDGAWHGSLLNYLFDYDLKTSDEDTRRLLLNRYIWFAQTGNPNSVVPGPAAQLPWIPVGATLNYLHIHGESSYPTTVVYESARFNPHSERLTFWNNLYDVYYKPPVAMSSADKLFSVAFVLVLAQFALRLF